MYFIAVSLILRSHGARYEYGKRRLTETNARRPQRTRLSSVSNIGFTITASVLEFRLRGPLKGWQETHTNWG
jgi:hypothetical protein